LLATTIKDDTLKQEPLLRMTIRSPDGALSRYLLPNGFPPTHVLLYAFLTFDYDILCC